MATSIKVVIGLNAGDEGKGQVTDYFASDKENCIVVLSNGGSQRGHTVTLPSGKCHVFHHFGSNIAAGLSRTYIPEYFIVNPMNFAMEYAELIRAKIYPYVYMDVNCKLTTPYDMIANQMIEESRGDRRHGSCGVGIWETILRNGISVGEMVVKTDAEKAEYLRFVRDNYFTNRISSKGIKPDKEWTKIIYSEGLIANYIRDFNIMNSKVLYASDRILNDFENIIFENGQGLLLDQNISGYGKNTTPSNTGLQNPAEMINKITNDVEVEVCYVTRTYMTRHGIGRFDTECKPDLISSKIIDDKTNHPNEFQGSLRYGVLDWKSAEERALKDFEKFGDPDWKISFFFTHANECSLPAVYNPHDYRTYISDNPTRINVKIF